MGATVEANPEQAAQVIQNSGHDNMIVSLFQPIGTLFTTAQQSRDLCASELR